MNDRGASENLLDLVAAARAETPRFDATSSLSVAVAKRANRARRERLVRRVIVGATAMSAFAVLLFRLSISSASPPSTSSPLPGQELAARALGDGGDVARD